MADAIPVHATKSNAVPPKQSQEAAKKADEQAPVVTKAPRTYKLTTHNATCTDN